MEDQGLGVLPGVGGQEHVHPAQARLAGDEGLPHRVRAPYLARVPPILILLHSHGVGAAGQQEGRGYEHQSQDRPLDLLYLPSLKRS